MAWVFVDFLWQKILKFTLKTIGEQIPRLVNLLLGLGTNGVLVLELLRLSIPVNSVAFRNRDDIVEKSEISLFQDRNFKFFRTLIRFDLFQRLGFVFKFQNQSGRSRESQGISGMKFSYFLVIFEFLANFVILY